MHWVDFRVHAEIYGRMEIPRVLRTSPRAKYRALGEEKHSGERVFPECLIVHGTGEERHRGRPPSPSATLGEERHTRTKNDVGK
jgi:hypothetical protein